jgi:ankyrin repeat protein
MIEDKGDKLYQAARKGDYHRVQELINQGADVNYKKQFLSHDEFPLNGAIKSGNLDIVKLLITHGAKIDREGDNRGSLNNAIWMSNKKIIQYLLSKGIYVDRSCSSSLIFSALSSASFEMLKFVVDDLGVCVNSKNYIYEETPLFETIYEERLQEAHYLIKKGAKINIQNKKKETPLHYAVSCDKIKMIELFLKNGADITIKDEKGLTPLDYAVKESNIRVVKLLKRYSK